MSNHSHLGAAKTAAVLPPPAQATLAPWIERVGYRLCSLDDHPSVLIIDFTHPDGSADLAALRLKDDCATVGILGVIGDASSDAQAALAAGADGFVAFGALAREFDLRLEAVRLLAVSRAEQARREKDLAVLLELTAHYAAALDVAALLHDVTRRLAEELSVDRCALVLIDEERDQGHIVAASDDRDVRDVRIELARYPEIREAVRTGRPVVVDDVGSHPLFDEVKEMVARRGIAALAAVPLAVQGKTLGVLLLRSGAGSRFAEHEISFAWTVAHATAIALRNARMLEGLRGQAEKAEAQVAELARYEEFFQYVSDGMAILDENGLMVSINPAAAQIFEITPEAVRGTPFAKFATPLSEPALGEMLSAVRRGLVCREIDLDVRASNDNLLTLSVCGSPIRGGRGMILSFRDVTAQRAMERELRKTKEFLEKLINSSVDAVVAADLHGTIILFNHSAERVLGWSAQDVVGQRTVRDLYSDETAQRVMELLRSDSHGGEGRLEPTRMELVAKDGERVPVLMSAALIYEGKSAVASVSIFSDLRERTRLEAKLTQTQEKLQEAERRAAIVALAGTTAHKLNQPLTVVMGYAEMLLRSVSENDPKRKPLEILYTQAERMATIVRNIGRIARYVTMQYVGDLTIIDLEQATVDEDKL